jgi:hypothetical protein
MCCFRIDEIAGGAGEALTEKLRVVMLYASTSFLPTNSIPAAAIRFRCGLPGVSATFPDEIQTKRLVILFSGSASSASQPRSQFTLSSIGPTLDEEAGCISTQIAWSPEAFVP